MPSHGFPFTLPPVLTRAGLAQRFWLPLFDDPAIIAQFKPHAGKTAAVTLPGNTLLFVIGDDGHIAPQPASEGTDTPDLHLVFSWQTLQALLTRDPQWRNMVHHDGDAALADDFLPLWDSVPTLLRQQLGDALPLPLTELAQRGLKQVTSGWSDLSDRLRFQKDDAIARFALSRQEFDTSAHLLQRLAQQTEALEQRIAALETGQAMPATPSDNNTAAAPVTDKK